jgi:hypothetical protein
MRRSRLVGAAVGLWMASFCLPAHAVLLRYTPKTGSVVTHKVASTNLTTVKSEVAAISTRTETTGTGAERTEVLGQERGGYKVRESTRGGTLTVTTTKSGRKSTHKEKLAPRSSLTIYDDHGRVVSVLSKASGGAPSESVIDVDDFMALGTIAFPEEEVKPGDTWSDEARVAMGEGMPELVLTVNCRLLALVTYHGRSCAKIRTSISGPLNLELSQIPEMKGLEGSTEGTVQGSIVQYYDYTTSSWLDADAKLTTTLSMLASVPAPGGVQSVPIEIRGVATIKMTVVK